MQELIKALVKARSSFTEIKKDKTNPHYKSRYATLDSVLAAVKPGLDVSGLAVVQTVDKDESGKPCLITTLYHESGESISSNYPLPETTDPQKLGSAITYGRRYSICGILNVVADEDDDGNGSNGNGSTKPSATKTLSSKPAAKPAAKQVEPKFLTPEQIDELRAIGKSTGYDGTSSARMLEEKGLPTSLGKIPYSKYTELKEAYSSAELLSEILQKLELEASQDPQNLEE